MRTDLQLELCAKEKRNEKANKMRKTTPREETASVGSRKANAHMGTPAHSSTNRTRMAEGTDDLLRLLPHVHRTEILKVTEKVVMTEAEKDTPKFTGQIPSGKANEQTSLYRFQVGSCQKGSSCNYWHVIPKVQNSKRQVDANTMRNLLMKRKISIDCCSPTIEW